MSSTGFIVGLAIVLVFVIMNVASSSAARTTNTNNRARQPPPTTPSKNKNNNNKKGSALQEYLKSHPSAKSAIQKAYGTRSQQVESGQCANSLTNLPSALICGVFGPICGSDIRYPPLPGAFANFVPDITKSLAGLKNPFICVIANLSCCMSNLDQAMVQQFTDGLMSNLPGPVASAGTGTFTYPGPSASGLSQSGIPAPISGLSNVVPTSASTSVGGSVPTSLPTSLPAPNIGSLFGG